MAPRFPGDELAVQDKQPVLDSDKRENILLLNEKKKKGKIGNSA